VQRGGVKTETDASRGNRIGEIDFDAFRHLEER
jgi:hypothetical protein